MNLTHCKLKKSTQKKLLEFFIAEVTARTAADLLEIQPNTAALFYHKIRQVISYYLALEAHEIFEGKTEADESYFGGHRKGKRGHGAAGKVAVFGLLEQQGKVFTVVVENTKTETPMSVMTRKINPDSWFIQTLDALDVGEFHHERINRKNFPLFLKECEFRFNFGTSKEQLKTLRKWCGI